MSIEPPDDRLKALWQDQPTEEPAVSVSTLRARADAFRRKNQLRNLVGLGVCAGCAVLFLVQAFSVPAGLTRTGFMVMVAGSVWMAWWIGRLWPEDLPAAEAGRTRLVEAQLAALRRQLTSFGRLMLLGAPIFAGLGVSMVGMALRAHSIARLIPIFAFLAVWFGFAWWLNRRNQVALRRRIAELEALRRE